MTYVRSVLAAALVLVAASTCALPREYAQACRVDADCPGPSTLCKEFTCSSGQCVEQPRPVGALVGGAERCPALRCGPDGTLVLATSPCCGNGVCESGETCGSCPEDCGSCCGDSHCDTKKESCSDLSEEACCWKDCGPQCGDGICEFSKGELCSSCDKDCGKCADAGCGDGICDASEDCESCPADCACIGLGYCEGGSCKRKCPSWCGKCHYETPLELDCPPQWNGNGVCDCGCQFVDEDCKNPCPAPGAPVYCASPTDTCCAPGTVACCPNPSCGCCGPSSTSCDAQGCCL